MPPSGYGLLSDHQRPLLLGHRGARAYASENTIEAFELALAHGCDGFEFDVRLSAGDQAVICHDPKFKGLEIQQTSIGQLTACGLPTLETVLQQFADRAFLDIELKVPGIERITADMVRRHRPSRGFVLTSFLPDVLRQLHALDSELPLGLICDRRKQIESAFSLPLAGLVVHKALVNGELLAEFRHRETPVFVWGANRASEMRSMVDAGIVGLIVDDTQLAAETLRPRNEAVGNPESPQLQ